MMTLNPYKITWAFLIPIKGIATKQDNYATSLQRGISKSHLSRHFSDIEDAKKEISKLKGKLSKEYKVLFITDKQFGQIQNNFTNQTDNLLEVATAKQKAEMFIIK